MAGNKRSRANLKLEGKRLVVDGWEYSWSVECDGSISMDARAVGDTTYCFEEQGVRMPIAHARALYWLLADRRKG